MTAQPHPDAQSLSIPCAVITVSDTRTPESDRSGKLIQELLAQGGHCADVYRIIPDEPERIQAQLKELCDRDRIQVLIFNGGTGIAPRDTTYDALEKNLDKVLPGFGELFRFLSYPEIGSRAIASRSVAGVYRNKLIFSLPGSTNAVKLAMQQLILPELVHLVSLLSEQ